MRTLLILQDQKKQQTNPDMIKPKVSSDVHKYEDIWKQLAPLIVQSLSKGLCSEINIGRAPFEAVGNRKSYSFRLELQDGAIANNIEGSAVARDLARVLMNNSKFLQAARSKRLILRLDKQFTLRIEII